MSAPSPPNPQQTAAQQAAYNTQAAQTQQKLNMFGQTNPYGSQTWNVDPNAPGGYSTSINMSPAEQRLLDILQGSQTNLGQQGLALTGGTAGMYSTPPDLLSQSGITGKYLSGLEQQYMNPIFQQQSSNLDAQLQNQGLTPGSEAYNNAKNLLARNQGDVTNQFLMQMQPMAFGQALQQYQLPLQTEAQIMGMTQPTLPNSAFVQTPTAQVQPPDYQSAVNQAYQTQAANYQNMIRSGAMLAGAVAGAPFTGGTSLFAAAPAFAGGWGSAPNIMGGQF